MKRSILVLVVISYLGSVSVAGLMDGLVAHYPFGANANDASGNAYDGTFYGDPVLTDGAVALDGDGDYVEIPGFKGITGSGNRTCSAWIKTNQPSGDIITWGEMGLPSYRWIVRLDGAGLLQVEVGGGYVSAATPLIDDQWHHVAVVLDGGNTDDIRLYVDGQIEAASGLVQRIINTSAANTVKIGVFTDTQRYFNGLIDDVRIYDRALSENEVLALYQIPEPTTLLLFGFGGLMLKRRR